MGRRKVKKNNWKKSSKDKQNNKVNKINKINKVNKPKRSTVKIVPTQLFDEDEEVMTLQLELLMRSGLFNTEGIDSICISLKKMLYYSVNQKSTEYIEISANLYRDIMYQIRTYVKSEEASKILTDDMINILIETEADNFMNAMELLAILCNKDLIPTLNICGIIDAQLLDNKQLLEIDVEGMCYLFKKCGKKLDMEQKENVDKYLDVLSQNARKLGYEYKVLVDEIYDMRYYKWILKKSYREMKVEIESMQQEIDDLEEENQEIHTKNKELEMKCMIADTEIRLRNKSNEPKKVCNASQSEVAEMRKKLNQYESLKVNGDQMNNKCIKLQQKYNKLEKQYKDMVSKKKTMEKRLDDVLDEYKELEMKYDRLQSVKSDMDVLTVQHTELTQKYNEQSKVVETVENERNVIQQRYNDLESEQKLVEIEVNKLQNGQKRQKIMMESIQTVNGKLKSENVEIKRLKEQMDGEYNTLISKQESTENKMDKLQDEYNELEIKYSDLETKYEQQRKTFGYLCWDATDIANWMVNIDKLRYGEYYNKLVTNMKKEGIDGECLVDLDKHDLHRLGITQFKDKRDICHEIKKLVRNNNKNNIYDDNESIIIEQQKQLQIKYNELNTKYNRLKIRCNQQHHNDKECVICMNNGRSYACLPCGHLCLCHQCKGINGKCPICLQQYISINKVYT